MFKVIQMKCATLGGEKYPITGDFLADDRFPFNRSAIEEI